MDHQGVSRFPGAEGRIPNFAGAKTAAERLTRHPYWQQAKVIKVNPDSPQTQVRRLALESGKALVTAVPRLSDDHPFRLLDPQEMTDDQIREASTIKGALKHGQVLDLEQVPKLDLVLAGAVAVNLKGARVGKGSGFSDLEYALLFETGKLDEHVPICTTVHPIQILRENLLMTAHDIPLDLVVTPRAVIEVDGAFPRTNGIMWDHLQPPQIHEIPVLERWGYAA